MLVRKGRPSKNEVAIFGRKCLPPKFNRTRCGEPEGNVTIQLKPEPPLIYREVMTDQKRDGWQLALGTFRSSNIRRLRVVQDPDAVHHAYIEVFDMGRGAFAFDCVHVPWPSNVLHCLVVGHFMLLWCLGMLEGMSLSRLV